MAVLIHTATIINTAVLSPLVSHAMQDPDLTPTTGARARGQRAEALLRDGLREAGWQVPTDAPPEGKDDAPDLIANDATTTYAIVVKTAAEGRSDRLVPLWAQACLEAVRVAGPLHHPLAVVAAPRVTPRAAEQVLAFAARYAPDVAVGIIDFGGFRRFSGAGLDDLDRATGLVPSSARPTRSTGSAALFSDTNQWLLKIVLAPELPASLLAAPRDRYRNASQLARAAGVSVMSAFRFVQQLDREGHLDTTAPSLTLVRRAELFRRWQAAVSVRPARELRLRYLLRGDPREALRRTLRNDDRACLALFAAADALGFGFVSGVPPHVYAARLGDAPPAGWKNVVVAAPGEPPDLIVRQAPTPRSIFGGAVRASDGDVLTSDVLQVWLDVSTHPTRGEEQAALIRRRALTPIFGT